MKSTLTRRASVTFARPRLQAGTRRVAFLFEQTLCR